jgi:hypothetical protein
MTDTKLLPPVAVCTKCGTTSRNAAAINQPHRRTPTGERCHGAFGSALARNDWERCPACDAPGRDGGARCAQCGGDGWLYVRKR